MKLRTLLAAAVVAAAFPGLASAEELVTLPTRPGVTQSFYLSQPASPPVASVILFTGGNGQLVQDEGGMPSNDNFLVRSRALFVAQGFTTAVIDVPSDEAGGMAEFRLSPKHRSDIAAVIAYLRQRAPVPVWLVGTSRGTISATNGATLETGGPDGLVLTSSVTRENKRHDGTVPEARPGQVKIPILLVHNRDDGCKVCPYSDIPNLLDRFQNAPRKGLISFQGGSTPLSEPCEALSRHGYIGLEDKVVAAIADWIKVD